MSEASQRPRFFSLQLQARHLFVPVTLLVVFLLRREFALPWWGLAAIIALLPGYYFLMPRLLQRRERAFDREVLRLLQQGRRQELLPLYRSQRLLRFFSPRGSLEKRLGFIYAELGDFERARACYTRAASSAPAGERLGVLLGLAQARYRSGDAAGAEIVYRELLRRGQTMPEVMDGLAHCLLLLGRDLREARTLAQKVGDLAPGSQMAHAATLTLAECTLARGKPSQARKLLQSLSVDDHGPWLEARRQWVWAQLAQHEGAKDEQQRRLEQVVALDRSGGLGERARQKLAQLETGDTEG